MGHATKCPVFLHPSSIEPLIFFSASRVRRTVARLAEFRASKEDVRVRVEAGRSDFLAQYALCDALRGEHVIQEILLSDL
jgi:hypothetical protein